MNAFTLPSSLDQPLVSHSTKQRKSCLWFAVPSMVMLFLGFVLFTCLHAHIGSPLLSSKLPETEKRLLANEDLVTACISTTRFPEVCISSLSTSPSASKKVEHDLVQVNIAKLATRVTLVGVKNLRTLSSNLKEGIGADQVREKAVLTDCAQVLDRAHDQLNYALQGLNHLHEQYSKSEINEIRTWLSATLAFHTTCRDELAELGSGSVSLLRRGGDYTEKLISNALAFATFLLGAAHSDNLFGSDWSFPLVHRRRRFADASSTSETSAESAPNLFPAWLSLKDVHLLQSASPLANVTVAADGSGNYTTVQDAVNAAPHKSSETYVIHIKRGIYDEEVIVPSSATNLMFLGDGIGATIITGNKNVHQPNITTWTSATVAIDGNGFLGKDITFQNTAGAINEQAVAIRVSADQTAFYSCAFEGYQDTLYTHSLRQFYRDCNIYGTVDFVFGDSAAVFQNCRLSARVPLLGQKNVYTAQGRTDANSNTGLSFHNCIVDGIPELQQNINQFPTYLGRPWKEYSRTVFLKCYQSSVVNPAGWLPWDKDFALATLFYGEYQCFGEGAGASERVPWSTQITDVSVAEQFTAENFVDGSEWLSNTGFPYQLDL